MNITIISFFYFHQIKPTGRYTGLVDHNRSKFASASSPNIPSNYASSSRSSNISSSSKLVSQKLSGVEIKNLSVTVNRTESFFHSTQYKEINEMFNQVIMNMLQQFGISAESSNCLDIYKQLRKDNSSDQFQAVMETQNDDCHMVS